MNILAFFIFVSFSACLHLGIVYLAFSCRTQLLHHTTPHHTMKTPDNTTELYEIIKGMEHRERVCFNLNPRMKQRVENAYTLEIYVTFPFGYSRLDSADQHRVLFSIVTADGKVCGKHKISVGRKFLSPKSKHIQKAFGMIAELECAS